MSIKAGVGFKLSGYEGTQIEKELERLINREVDSYVQRMATALKRSMKDTGRRLVTEWYSASGLSGGGRVASALRVEDEFLKRKNKKIVRLTSYFDGEVLDAMSDRYPSAQRWAAKHPDLITMSAGQYMFFLRWDLATIALPERAHFTGSGWVNENYEFSSLGPLKQYYCNNILTSVTNASSQYLRQRNRFMGAGTLSANRGGLSNLRH